MDGEVSNAFVRSRRGGGFGTIEKYYAGWTEKQSLNLASLLDSGLIKACSVHCTLQKASYFNLFQPSVGNLRKSSIKYDNYILLLKKDNILTIVCMTGLYDLTVTARDTVLYCTVLFCTVLLFTGQACITWPCLPGILY